MKVYLSGPMTGYAESNYPAFHAAATILRQRGYEVLSPAELHVEHEQTWEWYLRQDIKLLLECEIVYVLPGWRDSKGANLEVYIARQLGMPVHEYKP